jgi:DNA-directed RNA polymerase subunit L
MNVEIVSFEKNEVELKVDNLTVAEILRTYLYEQDVEFAAWRREHPSKPLIFKIKGTNVKKSVSDAISALKKDCNQLLDAVKK